MADTAVGLGLWSRHQESVFSTSSKDCLCGNAQVMGVQKTPCIGMDCLAICIEVEQQRGNDDAFCVAANYIISPT